MADAVQRGAIRSGDGEVKVTSLFAAQAGPLDLIRSDAVIFATPENFGYLSGAMKDFLDRVFYPCQGRLEGMPYSVVIGAGNDGSGALKALRRIVRGLALHEVQEAIICQGRLEAETIERCEELGETMSAGLAMGVF
ncbi:MAG: NAD(P)H-dependent oxidoreductase [Ectothiorhodospiraceae bacterium AqS1]|nr:NAD(P)H-dependent oxidoreductase [Ectothiorhodospiraceae bacterium AqS1]